MYPTEHPGTSAHLFKPGSKRRRTKQELIEAKKQDEQEKTRIEQLEAKIQQIESFVVENERLKEEAKEGENAKDAIKQMLSSGFLKIDERGQLQPAQPLDNSSQGSRNVTGQLRSKKKSDGPITAPIVPHRPNNLLNTFDDMEDSDLQ